MTDDDEIEQFFMEAARIQAIVHTGEVPCEPRDLLRLAAEIGNAHALCTRRQNQIEGESFSQDDKELIARTLHDAAKNK